MLIKQIKGCIWLYRCDWCSKEFEGPFSKSKNKTHGCCRSCGSKASRSTVKANLLIKYGVENVGQLFEVREKVKKTLLERYGVKHCWQIERVKRQIKETMIQRYGASSPWQVPEIRLKIENNNIRKYGVKHVWQNSVIRQKSKLTMINRYGVDNPQKSPEIQLRTRKTCLTKYGAENPFASTMCRAKSIQTWLKNYGVNNPTKSCIIKEKVRQTCYKRYGYFSSSQSPVIQQKIVKSFLVKGKGFISKVEFRCLKQLQELFGDVQHQVTVNGWLIDFYIKSINTYLQLDGVYWHGLLLTQIQLDNPDSKREKDIVRKWKRDHEQIEWFKQNSLQLVRITDLDYISWETQNCVKQLLCSVIGC